MISPADFPLIQSTSSSESIILELKGWLSTHTASTVYDSSGSAVKPEFKIFDENFKLKNEYFEGQETSDQSSKEKQVAYDVYLLKQCLKKAYAFNDSLNDKETLHLEEKVALVLLNSTGQNRLHEIAILKGLHSDQNQAGILPGPFKLYLDAVGPYIFCFAPVADHLKNRDFLLSACALSDENTVRVFLNHYVNNFKKYDRQKYFRFDYDQMCIAARQRSNNGIIDAIKYVTNDNAEGEDNGKKHLTKLFLEDNVKDVKIVDVNGGPTTNADFGIPTIYNHIQSRMQPDETPPSTNVFSINNSDPQIIKPSGMTPANWAVAAFMCTAAVMGCVVAGLWDSSVYSEFYEKMLGIEDGSLKGSEKASLFAVSTSIFVPSFAAGCFAYAVSASRQKPKIVG